MKNAFLKTVIVPMIATIPFSSALALQGGINGGGGSLVVLSGQPSRPADLDYVRRESERELPKYRDEKFDLANYPGLEEAAFEIAQSLDQRHAFNGGWGNESKPSERLAEGLGQWLGAARIVFITDRFSAKDELTVEAGLTQKQVAYALMHEKFVPQGANGTLHRSFQPIIELDKEAFENVGTGQERRRYQALILIHELFHLAYDLPHDLLSPILKHSLTLIDLKKRHEALAAMPGNSRLDLISEEEYLALSESRPALHSAYCHMGWMQFPQEVPRCLKSMRPGIINRKGGGLIVSSLSPELLSRFGNENYVDSISTIAIGPMLPEEYEKRHTVQTPEIAVNNVVAGGSYVRLNRDGAVFENNEIRDSQVEIIEPENHSGRPRLNGNRIVKSWVRVDGNLDSRYESNRIENSSLRLLKGGKGNSIDRSKGRFLLGNDSTLEDVTPKGIDLHAYRYQLGDGVRLKDIDFEIAGSFDLSNEANRILSFGNGVEADSVRFRIHGEVSVVSGKLENVDLTLAPSSRNRITLDPKQPVVNRTYDFSSAKYSRYNSFVNKLFSRNFFFTGEMVRMPWKKEPQPQMEFRITDADLK